MTSTRKVATPLWSDGRSIGAAALVAALLGIALPAAAQSAGPDEIHLTSGGYYRGTITLIETDEEVRIQLVGGRIVTIEWSRIEHIGQGEAGRRPPPSPIVPSEPQVPAEPEPEEDPSPYPAHVRAADLEGYAPGSMSYDPNGPREVRIRLRGAPGAALIRDGSDAVVCLAPCGENHLVPRHARYYVDRDGMPPTAPFSLFAGDGRAEVVVDPGHSLLRNSGIALTVVGGLGFLGAGIYTAVEHRGLSYFPPEPEPLGTAIGSGIGLVTCAAGVIMWIVGETDVAVSDTAREGWSWAF